MLNAITWEAQGRCRFGGVHECFLAVSGSCIEPQPEVDALIFRAPVRATVTATAKVCNSTDMAWQLRPVLEPACLWTGPQLLTVPANGHALYPVTCL